MRYTTEELKAMPVITRSQADDLHYEDSHTRVWLSRTGVADGEPFDNTVTVEHRTAGRRWFTVGVYNGDDPNEIDLHYPLYRA